MGWKGGAMGPLHQPSSRPRRISRALRSGAGGTSRSPRSQPISTDGSGCRRMVVGTCQSGANVLGRSWGMTCSARPSSAAISSYSSPTSKPYSNKGHAMHWEPIHKSSRTWSIPPNLQDYDQTCAAFSWEAVRCELDGLPGGRGLNIAHEAVDRHANGARRDHLALRWLGKDGTVGDFTVE